MQPRTQTVQAIRQYFEDHHFEEIIPMVLSNEVVVEPTIYPFVVEGKMLATSPEASLKQALACGARNCFAVSPSFRSMEGRGRWHQPEFLMTEWYEKDTTWTQQMQRTQDLVTLICPRFGTPHAWPTVSWIDLWNEYLSLNLNLCLSDQKMKEIAHDRGYNPEDATWEQLFNQISLNEIEPHFTQDPFFLIDFPARISPLAQPQKHNAGFAERFELIINRVELANGNTEYFDESEIRKTIKGESFLHSIKKLSGQQWAGVGLGVDRLTALITDSSVERVQRYE